ncbi:MAG: hypothetical protein JNL66_23155 [Alphaproteobacteria bacterium]|nr:hypothetical protein [Alphaproteobacteria bacterium]
MNKRLLGLALGAMMVVALPALAQPVGTFDVAGPNYQGAVTVTQTGQTFNVLWTVGTQRFQGVGIFVNGVLSVGYSGEGNTGVAVYREVQSGVWEGPWAFVGQATASTERWTRRGGAAAPAAPGGGAPAK